MFFVQVIYITLATIGTYLSACERIGDFATGIVAQYNPRCLARFSRFLLDLPQVVFPTLPFVPSGLDTRPACREGRRDLVLLPDTRACPKPRQHGLSGLG
jgi:hypothetical protein